MLLIFLNSFYNLLKLFLTLNVSKAHNLPGSTMLNLSVASIKKTLKFTTKMM